MKIIGCNKLGIMLVVLFGLVGVLVGCDEGEFMVDADFGEEVDYKSETKEIINNTLEYKYQTEVTEFIEELIDFTKSTYDPILLAQVTNANRDSLIRISNDFTYTVNDFNPTPVTEKDEQFDKYVHDLKSQSEKLVYYALNYINDKDKTDKNLYMETYDKLSITIGLIGQLEENLYQ